MPGGAIESGENIKFAAQRELKEETGYVSKNPELIHAEVYELPNGKKVKRCVFFDIYDGK